MNILSKPTATYEQCEAWAKKKKASKTYMDILPQLYSIAEKHGVNPCLVVAQCAKETGYCRFGGVLDASFKNTCGLKSSKGGGDKDPNAHARFKTWEDGITAQVEHLCLYAGKKGFPVANPKDPRHFPYLKGECKTIEGLSGKWAGKGYGENLVEMCKEIASIKVEKKNKLTDKQKLEYIKQIINS